MRKFLFHYQRQCLRGTIMALLFSFAFIPLSAIAAQEITVRGQALTFTEVIKLIEKNSDYTFFYDANALKKTERKDVDCKGSIENVLNEVFKGSNIHYVIKGNEVILKVENAKSTPQQSSSIIGVVTDSKTSEPVIGATVMIKGTQTGVITDVDGKFEIPASRGDILVVQFIGYTSKEIKIGSQKVITVTLAEDSQQLDEVVVTAFGTGQKKESITGSIQSIRPSDLVVPASNLSTTFAGRLSGVVAYQRSGEPGKNSANFYIRGISTLSGVTSPLIVMDGVEISSADLNSIDPEVIESFSILKDATATAMYGTRGANGVMIVKTKSGADLEKPIIGFRVEANVTTPTKVPKFVGATDYMRMYNEAVTNQGTGDILFSNEQMNGVANNLNPYIYPNVDWYNEMFNNAAFNQKANFNIRGGTQKITYFMNLNMNHETGMLKNKSHDYYSYNNNINLKKYAFQNNIDFHLSKTATIALHLNVQLNDGHGPRSTDSQTAISRIFGSIMNANPVDYPITYPSTETENWYKWGAMGGGNTQGASNPMAEMTDGYEDTFESTVIANIDYDQKLDFITKGLRFKALLSFKNWSYSLSRRSQGYNKYNLSDYTQNADGSFDYEVTPVGEPTRHTLSTANSTNGDRRFYFQTYIDYNRSFEDHNVSAMILYNQDEYNSFSKNESLISSLPKRKIGIAGRLSYDYAHRYMVELNAGYNGSENFAEGHRWGFFPSASLGWNISEEAFWKPLKHIVSNFKIRGSYGLVGNDQIGSDRFIYLADVTLQNGDLNYQTGYGDRTQSYNGPTYNRYQNNEITWEVGHKLNIGTDIQLFNSLNLTIDAFQEIRDNIFQKKNSIPNYLGASGSTIYGNLAKVKNWGVDMSADYGKQFNKDLSVMFKGTFTFARNKVLEYDEAPGLRPAMSQVGRRLNTFLGYVADGLYIDEADIANSPKSTLGNIAIAPGDVKYVDQPDANGHYDGQITSDDRVEIGHPTIPEIVYGFGPTIQWKQWDFSFFFQGQANVSLMMSGFYPFGAQYNRNVLEWIADDYWSINNQNINAAYPRLTKSENNNNNQTSTYWLRNAAFLKLKNAEIGYSFKNARVYLSGMNLLTFSPFKHWDPEMGGGSGLAYPTQRTFNVGIQVTFR
ncbi:TonB-dependent receptor [Parabacteroides segnis]|uniref:TonB-dependent receptor n=1 Tax=Parabacteroides segnis TaxID=2763058 RepID=UPI003511B36D